MSVSLTEHLCQFVDEQVNAGHYRTASEVVRDGLRLLEREQVRAQKPHGNAGAERKTSGLPLAADGSATLSKGLSRGRAT
ncbi:type II toxin-antitoxin system ParD family antitoxin [Paraburkholderia megapolitana]|uniref:type II toxin-antitoxin system ParD family antitoxin n=1 Tax=Paraburkholderia megapolitana TaxID=420953 RepID=UPI0038B7FEAE